MPRRNDECKYIHDVGWTGRSIALGPRIYIPICLYFRVWHFIRRLESGDESGSNETTVGWHIIHPLAARYNLKRPRLFRAHAYLFPRASQMKNVGPVTSSKLSMHIPGWVIYEPGDLLSDFFLRFSIIFVSIGTNDCFFNDIFLQFVKIQYIL